MEEVVQQMKTTRHPRLIACDANVCPEDFKKSHVVQKADTCSLRRHEKAFQHADPEGPNGELIERTYDHAIASHSLQGKIKHMEVVWRDDEDHGENMECKR